MKYRLFAMALIVLLVGACSSEDHQDVTPQGLGPDDPPMDTRPDESCDTRLDDPMSRWAAAGFSGALALSSPERACFMRYGTADTSGRSITTDTLFSLGSVSKLVTAVAVLSLAEQGFLSLQDRTGDLVREMSGPAAAATIEQLMTHTSGLLTTHAADYAPLSQADALSAIGS